MAGGQPAVCDIAPIFFGPASAQSGANGDKSLAWRLAALYLLLGLVAALFETQAYGELHAQGRQFYAVTTCLFIVFAYPGFVARYLWRRHKG